MKYHKKLNTKCVKGLEVVIKSYVVVNDGELDQPIILTTAALSLTSQFFANRKKTSIIQHNAETCNSKKIPRHILYHLL